MRRARAVSLVLAVLFAGCAMFGGTAKPYSAMTPAEKVTFYQEFYNKQFDDVASMSRLDLTEGQLTVYRAKREALVQMKPLIRIYKSIVDGGGIPSPEDEAAIMDLINRMVAAGG